MSREKRCEHTLDNGKRCTEQLSGRGVSKFCSKCRNEAKKQAKSRTNRAYYASLSKPGYKVALEHHREVNKRCRGLSYHGLTKPKLRPLVCHSMILHEEFHYKADLYEYALHEIDEINLLLLYPADLTTTAALAKKKAEDLYLQLQRDTRPNRVTEILISYVQEPLRDIGQRMSPNSFIEIGRKAKAVRKMWLKQGMLLNLVLALFVEVELHRLQFMAESGRRDFWDKAYTRLLSAASVCNRDLYTDDQKKLAGFLGFYTHLGLVRLWLDIEEPEQAASSILAIQQQAAAVMDSWGDGPVTQTTSYLSSLAQAEYHMHRKDFDSAYGSLAQAEQTLVDTKWRRIDEDISIPYLKARLALSTGYSESQCYVHEYVSLCERYPFLSYIYYLRRLKQLYPTEIADEALPTNDCVFVETFFRHISPYLRPKL
jgi:hypothetical protein